MPKATAVWLIENTSLTFDQIADFSGLHNLEIQALADEDSGMRILGLDPLLSGQLTQEEIKRCEQDSSARLIIKPGVSAETVLNKKKSRYTPLAKRQDRPDAIAWVIKFYPLISDPQICRLLGTTRPTVQAVRSKTHWNSANIKPKNPVLLGLCSQKDLDEVTRNYSGTDE
jgi:hypothetical protein